MLVLSRKVRERIVIGDGIVLTVVSVHGPHVRIGIEAPDSVAVWREELLHTETTSRSAPTGRETRRVEIAC